MKRLVLAVGLALMLAVALFVPFAPAPAAEAACYGSTYVSGYYRGYTYVQGYYRTCPDSSVYNNYSYSGNYNPYTGSYGTRSYSSYTPSYYSGVQPRYSSYYAGVQPSYSSYSYSSSSWWR